MVDWSCLYIHTRAKVVPVTSNVYVIEKKNKILEINMSGGGGGGGGERQGGTVQELGETDSAANKREIVVNVESSSAIPYHYSNRHSLRLRNSAFIPPAPLAVTSTLPKVSPTALLYSLPLCSYTSQLA